MKHYIIDGNNLIGKIKRLQRLQQKDKQGSRDKLAFIIDSYFTQHKAKVTLHFDGHPGLPIKISKAKIVYSEDKIADDKIRDQIEAAKNRKNLVVVTSDGALKQFASVCGCDVILSEDFGRELTKKNNDDEKKRIDEMNKNLDEFKKLFGA